MEDLKNSLIVIKYGGNAMLNDGLKAQVIADIAELRKLGAKIVLVHGGGPEIAALLKALGRESRFVNGLRCTDAGTMEAVQMALNKVNKDLTVLLVSAGAAAAGLCGLDNALLTAVRETREDLGFVGSITGVNTEFINLFLDAGIIPVISPVSLCTDRQGGGVRPVAVNVNADTAAAEIAAALKADKFILMTDVPGILRDPSSADSLIPKISTGGIDALKKEGVISRGMIPKTDCVKTALSGGARAAFIIDGREPHVLLSLLAENKSRGTEICL